MTAPMKDPTVSIFKIDENGYPRFTNAGFMPRAEAETMLATFSGDYEILSYGEYKARQDPDSMPEAELRKRLGKSPVAPMKKVVVITGTFSFGSRADAKKRAEALGFRVVSQISGDVTHLWCGEKPGAKKLELARTMNISVISTLEGN